MHLNRLLQKHNAEQPAPMTYGPLGREAARGNYHSEVREARTSLIEGLANTKAYSLTKGLTKTKARS